MAELGDFLTQGPMARKEVTVEMMDYKYVDDCQDPAELRAILARLKSGEEGHFPHLNQYVEDKLMSLLPDKERKKVITLRSGPRPDDISEAEASLDAWLAGVRQDDEFLLKQCKENAENPNKAATGRALPPVRGKKAPLQPAGSVDEDEDEDEDGAVLIEDVPRHEAAAKRPASHVYDAPEYFRRWDRFDVEAEEKKIEDVERKEEDEATQARRRHDALQGERAQRRQKELQQLRSKLQCSSMTPMQRVRMAMQEKNKGNECYKAGEAEEAMSFYSRALALLDESNPETPKCWANRAMAALKLGLLEKAEEDCSKALDLDPMYHKARLRRGMTRHRRGRYREAIEDFDALVRAAPPDMRDVDKLAERSRQKLAEVEGERLTTTSTSAGVIREVGERVSLPIVDGAPPTLDADEWEVRPVVPASDAQFKRITIVEADSDEDDEDAPAGDAGAGDAGFTRIAISAESDDSDSDEDAGEPVHVQGSGAGSLTRIAIVEDDSDSADEELEEEHSGDAGAPPAAGGAVRIQIEEEDDTDSDDDGVDGQVAPERTPSASCPEPDAEPDEFMSEWEANELKEKGVRLIMNNRYEEATETLDRAVAGIERAADAQGKPRDSYTMWNALHNNLAACAVAQGQWDAALKHADAILACQPRNLKALVRRAEACERLGKHPEALKDLRFALSVDPANPQVAERLKALQEKTGANGASGSGVGSSPTVRSDELKEQGNAFMQAGKCDEALERYTDALAMNPRNIAARNNRVVCFIELGRLGEAEKDATQVLTLEPENQKALRRRAAVREKLGRLADAVTDLRALMVVDPANKETLAHFQTLEARLKAKQPPAPVARAQEADAHMPLPPAPPVTEAGGARLASDKAKAEGTEAMKRGDFAQALVKYTEAVELDASNTAARNNRVACLLKLRNWGEADVEAGVVLEQDPRNAKALFRRSQARVELGNLDGALADAHEVLKIEPANKPAETQVARVKAMLAAARSPEPAAPREPVTPATVPVADVQSAHANGASAPSGNSGTVRIPIEDVDSESDDDDDDDGGATLPDPARSEQLKVAGNDKLKAGDVEGACRLYTEALVADESNVAARNNRAQCYVKQRDWQRALEDCAAVLTADPTNCKALYRQALALHATGRATEAQSCLREVLRIEPKNKPALAKLAELEGSARSKEQLAPVESRGAVEPMKEVASRRRGDSATKAPSAGTSSDHAKPTVTPVAVPAASKPQSPPTRKASGPTSPVQARTIPSIKAQVPTKPPKTMYELERVWRELRGDPKDFAEYLKCFKDSTFKKVFRESTNPDILPSLLDAVASHLASPEQSPKVAIKVLKNIAETPSFSMTKLLFSEQDTLRANRALDLLVGMKEYQAQAKKLKKAYGV